MLGQRLGGAAGCRGPRERSAPPARTPTVENLRIARRGRASCCRTATNSVTTEGGGIRKSNDPGGRRTHDLRIKRDYLTSAGHLALIILGLVSGPPISMAALMVTFTASSIGSLKGTSTRSRPCS